MITVDMKQRKIFSDGKEITGITDYTLTCAPGHKRLSISRIKVDETGRPYLEFGELLIQSLEYEDDEFEVIA